MSLPQTILSRRLAKGADCEESGGCKFNLPASWIVEGKLLCWLHAQKVYIVNRIKEKEQQKPKREEGDQIQVI